MSTLFDKTDKRIRKSTMEAVFDGGTHKYNKKQVKIVVDAIKDRRWSVKLPDTDYEVRLGINAYSPRWHPQEEFHIIQGNTTNNFTRGIIIK